MEAIRPIESHHQHIEHDGIDDLPLPPPPEPFPLEQLVGSSSRTNGGGGQLHVGRNEQSKQNVRNYLSSVQRSCINALTSLLPETSRSSDPSSSETQLPPSVAQLASALTDLLEVTYELDDLLPPSTNISPSTIHTESFPSDNEVNDEAPQHKIQASFSALRDLLEGLQDARLKDDVVNEKGRQHLEDEQKRSNGNSDLHPAIHVVREELAWQRLESLSNAISRLSQSSITNATNAESKRDSVNSVSHNGLPPSYQQFLDSHPPKESDNTSLLPSYHDIHSVHSTKDESGPSSPLKSKETNNQQDPTSNSTNGQQPTAAREKMLQELDSLTSAIERLSSVAPRLHDQRVEMKNTASTSKSSKILDANHQNGVEEKRMSKEDKIKLERQKMKELEEIWDKIERAHGKRRIRVEEGQRADGDGWERRRKERFINRIVDQAEARRLEDQDSVMGNVDAELARARDLRDRDHFLRDLIDSSGERRLDDQDAIVPKVADRRASLIESLMDYSTSGRLRDQDSLPPTPRHGVNGERVENPFELVTVQDFLASGGPDRRRSLGGDALLNSTNDEEGVAMGRSRSNSVPLDDVLGKKVTSGRSTPTAFKKIAGLMRRGSGHLGLKANSGFDISNLAYVAEHQENLHSVQITLHGVGISANLELQVETNTINVEEAIITSKKDPSVSIRIALPVAVQPGQSVIFTPQSLHLEAKLIAQPSSPSAISLLPTYPLSAPDIRKVQPRSICCTACDRQISTLPTGDWDVSYKDLPSEHWAEMMEVWMCHNDPSFTARLAERTKEGFWPQHGGILVGGSYLLVGEERIKWDNVTIEEVQTAEPWNVISCTCGEILGKQRANDHKPGAGTVRFSKWAIALQKQDDEDDNDELIRFPLSVFVVSDMLELSQAHASHRFVICDEETGSKKVYVWLFNPSAKMSYARPSDSSPLPSPLRRSMQLDHTEKNRVSRRSSIASSIGGKSPNHTTQKVLRAAKVMYKVVDHHTDLDLDNLPGFGPGGQVETLSYPSNICDRLINTLKDSSAVYPIGRRSMGAFDVGFLERT